MPRWISTASYPATVNDPAATELAIAAAQAVAGEARVGEMPKPTMGGEDFSFMLNAKPGSYIMLGATAAATRCCISRNTTSTTRC